MVALDVSLRSMTELWQTSAEVYYAENIRMNTLCDILSGEVNGNRLSSIIKPNAMA